MNQGENMQALLDRCPDLAQRLVTVRRQPNDWRDGCVRVCRLDGLTFDVCSGGVGVAFASEMLCAYVWCSDIEQGQVAHSCSHGPPPHRIKVCLPQSVNDRRLWRVLHMTVSHGFDIDVAERIVRTGRKNGVVRDASRASIRE